MSGTLRGNSRGKPPGRPAAAPAANLAAIPPAVATAVLGRGAAKPTAKPTAKPAGRPMGRPNAKPAAKVRSADKEPPYKTRAPYAKIKEDKKQQEIVRMIDNNERSAPAVTVDPTCVVPVDVLSDHVPISTTTVVVPAGVQKTRQLKPMFKLLIDNREKYCFSYLHLLVGIRYDICCLTIGDYAIIDENTGKIFCVVERKTLEDYSASIKDGRLYTQKKALIGLRAATKCKLLYIIEGKAFMKEDKRVGNIPYRYLESSMFHTMIRDEIPMIRTETAAGTIDALRRFINSMTTMLGEMPMSSLQLDQLKVDQSKADQLASQGNALTSAIAESMVSDPVMTQTNITSANDNSLPQSQGILQSTVPLEDVPAITAGVSGEVLGGVLPNRGLAPATKFVAPVVGLLSDASIYAISASPTSLNDPVESSSVSEVVNLGGGDSIAREPPSIAGSMTLSPEECNINVVGVSGNVGGNVGGVGADNGVVSGGRSKGAIPLELQERKALEPEDVFRRLWSCFRGITTITADIYMRNFSIYMVISKQNTIIEELERVNPKINLMVKKSIKSADKSMDVKLLSCIPGVSEKTAKEIINLYRLKVLLTFPVGAISIIKVGKNQKNLGEIRAMAIVKYLTEKYATA